MARSIKQARSKREQMEQRGWRLLVSSLGCSGQRGTGHTGRPTRELGATGQRGLQGGRELQCVVAGGRNGNGWREVMEGNKDGGCLGRGTG